MASMNDSFQASMLACRLFIRREYFLCAAEGRGLLRILLRILCLQPSKCTRIYMW
jgi:hypothetical protein